MNRRKWAEIDGWKLFFAAEKHYSLEVEKECVGIPLVFLQHTSPHPVTGEPFGGRTCVAVYCHDNPDSVRLARNVSRRAWRRIAKTLREAE